MAGIEQLEIHSKSYIVRWVKVEEGHTISWSVQPHKKSINFGIVKHPGTGSTGSTNPTLQTTQADDSSSADRPISRGVPDAKTGLFKRDAMTAEEQLAKKGFIAIRWHGKCEADKLSTGTYDVTSGGMYGLVFDNTFSKQTSKTATFELLTYPTCAPPQTCHLANLRSGSNASGSGTSLGRHSSPHLAAAASDSVDSLHSHPKWGPVSLAGRSEGNTPGSCHVGNLLKRRRKKGQGYARRFFSLDFTTCTLSYYHNRNSSALRGAIPLSLAAIAADERRREISIDSGAEVWHLKASNAKEYDGWASSLERASRIARGMETMPGSSNLDGDRLAPCPGTNMIREQGKEDREWQQVETLVSRIVGTRDALRRLVQDMAAQKDANTSHTPLSAPAAWLSEDVDGYFPSQTERQPFWKRKSSAASTPATTPLASQSGPSSKLGVPTPEAGYSRPARSTRVIKREVVVADERKTHEHCAALLSDLDSVVVSFSHLLGESKRRRLPIPGSATSRKSYESCSTVDEFFDAEGGDAERQQSQVVHIDAPSEEDTPGTEAEEVSVHDSSSISSVEGEKEFSQTEDGSDSLFPPRPKSLAPLPIRDAVSRRQTIPPATVLPPSLIAFVRKNVGKDVSTLSMPVSANEPISLLQRSAEQLEYAQLLDTAAKLPNAHERLLYVAAFAVSYFSNGRARERAIRKPFNPLLGETFELVRTEADVPGGFRLLAEKVCHRPVRVAMQADSALWSLAQTAAPTQKFWGKSAEITTEGRIRLVLRLNGGGDDERYSWNVATMFLRNVVMGEKYIEPTGTMTVSNDTSGCRANIEFKSKGMFGGRAEDVQVEAVSPDGRVLPSSLSGTWTTGLKLLPANQVIWYPGPLVSNAASTYGLTVFAAQLNEITEVEKGRLPPTDTRLRPDQRLAEQANLESAEEWKTRLEDAQRTRRRLLDESGEEHRPRWFSRLATAPDGEEVWKIKSGKDGYWEERTRAKWDGLEDLFAA